MKRVVVGKSADAGNVCSVDGTGGIVCWGANDNGKLGIGQNTPGPFMPTPIEALVTGSLSLGGDFSLATKGTDVVGWGFDDTWQQGHMNGTSNVPVGGSGQTADAVAAGSQHGCAIAKGVLSCWGANLSGQLGFGNNMTPQYPSSVSLDGKTVHEVACGEAHTCVRLVENGRVKCWGANVEGQLGVDSFEGTNQPGNDTLQNATAIAVGLGHSGAVVGGEVFLWGRNTTKQVSANLGAAVSKPNKVAGIPGSVVKLALGRAHSCALNKGGKVFCWGANIDGQCGTGAKSIDPAPPTVVVFK